MISFPDLTASDIEVRVSRIIEKPQGAGIDLLLYKDARCDMRILDETVGNTNWMRSHELRDGRNYCTVSVRDPETMEWVSKEDCGTAGQFEADKSAASDAFKRACFNWGIGRELYTAPEIFVWQKQDGECFHLDHKNGNPVCYDKFSVSQVVVENHAIKAISIKNENSGKFIFRWDGRNQ